MKTVRDFAHHSLKAGIEGFIHVFLPKQLFSVRYY